MCGKFSRPSLPYLHSKPATTMIALHGASSYDTLLDRIDWLFLFD